MKVDTKAYGPLEIADRQLITFDSGPYGFERFRDYVLLDAEQKPFYWLQSTESKELAFILIDPFLFRPDYEPDIPDADLERIGVGKADDVLLFAVVTTIAGGPITANLMGPVIVNKENRRACQVILGDPRWKTKHDIMAEMAAAGAKPC